MPVVIETWEEYRDRHQTPENPMLGIGGRICFPDGASCSEDTRYRQEPPEHPTQLLQAKRRYFAEKAERAEHAFDSGRNDLLRVTGLSKVYNNFFPASDADLDRLRGLKSKMLAAQGELKAIDDALEQTPEAQERRKAQEQLAAKAAQANLIEQQIMSI